MAVFTGLGSAASPSITFSADTNTGIFSPGADQVAISTNGTEKARLTSDGFLGLNVISPTGTLHARRASPGQTPAPAPSANGNLGVFECDFSNGISILTPDTSTGAIFFGATSNTRFAEITANLSATEIRVGTRVAGGVLSLFSDNALERARIDSSGRLLVGTSTSIGFDDQIQSHGTGGNNLGLGRFTNDAGGPGFKFYKSRSGTVGTNTLVQAGDNLGNISFRGANGSSSYLAGAVISTAVEGTPGASSMGCRLTFSTTADGASSQTERMRITNVGSADGNLVMYVGGNGYHGPADGRHGLAVYRTINNTSANAANSVVKIGLMQLTSRSINAAGTVNASGADYAEYMTKASSFEIAKGDICGVTADGKLTNVFADAVGFLVKSTNPSYVGGDTWGNVSVVGERPDAEDAELLAEWEAALEAERQKVDRIAFAGQVPVNVTGATPGQYIVPIATEDGGITGIAKNEADLTLAEYMRSVGKVIAIEDDGRARIIVKVA